MQFTTLVNHDYLPGLFALLQSLRERGRLPETSRFLIVCEQLPAVEVRSRLQATGFPVDFLDRRELGDAISHVRQIKPYHEYAYKKVLMFRVPLTGPVCYIDADMLCLNPVAELAGFGHFTAAPDAGISLEPSPIEGYPMFNTGLMVYEPSADLSRELIEHIDRYKGQSDSLGDQIPINQFFYSRSPQSVRLLDRSWNTLKRVLEYHPQDFNLATIRLLHFVGPKPWEWDRRLRSEWPYAAINRLWWSFFRRSPGAGLFPSLPGPPTRCDSLLLPRRHSAPFVSPWQLASPFKRMARGLRAATATRRPPS